MKQKPITAEIRELRAMPVPKLVDRYETVFGKPPRVKNREWLWKRVAWKIQEQRYGGLSKPAQARLEELIAEIRLPVGENRRTVTGALSGSERGVNHRATAPPVGTTLTREWHGQEIRVRVVDQGFEWDDALYKSLSAAAKAVTGSHWNGRLFFGLTKRKVAK